MCHPLIESDPAVKMGKPVIRGARITVEMILEKLAAGETIADLLDAYPSLTEEAIRAALTFAAEALRSGSGRVKFVDDEDVDHRIIERLRADGHDLLSISETSPRVTDDVVLDSANHERRPLITEDKGFGEMVVRQRRLSLGLILIRLDGLSPRTKAEIVSNAIREHESEIPGSFSVISPGSVRIRPIEQ